MKITIDVPDTTEGLEVLASIRSSGGVLVDRRVKRATVDAFTIETETGELYVAMKREPAPAPKPPAYRIAVNPVPAGPDRDA